MEITRKKLNKEEYLQRLYDNKSTYNFAKIIQKEQAKELKKVIGDILQRNVDGINKCLLKADAMNRPLPKVELRLNSIDKEAIKRWFIYATPDELQEDVTKILNTDKIGDAIIRNGMEIGLTEYRSTKINRNDTDKVAQRKTSVSKAFNAIAHLVFVKIAPKEVK